MFNLTGDEAHTFYVGQNGWLVHNDTRLVPNLSGLTPAQAEQTLKHFGFNLSPRQTVDTRHISFLVITAKSLSAQTVKLIGFPVLLKLKRQGITTRNVSELMAMGMLPAHTLSSLKSWPYLVSQENEYEISGRPYGKGV